MKKDIEERQRMILKQEPFKHVMRIKELKPLYDPMNAVSGQAFWIKSREGKEYKLRYCKKLKDAWGISKNAKRWPHIFPKFYGREGRYLLFEWVPGPELTKKEPLSLYEKLGELAGEVHEFDEEISPRKAKKYFMEDINSVLDSWLGPIDNLQQ